MKRNQGFTMVELVVVIGIIVFLAAMLIVAGHYIIVQLPQKKTETLSKNLELAALAFKQEHRVFPPTWKTPNQFFEDISEGDGFKYLDGFAKDSNGVPLDGWGQPIEVRLDDDGNLLFISGGPDKDIEKPEDNIVHTVRKR